MAASLIALMTFHRHLTLVPFGRLSTLPERLPLFQHQFDPAPGECLLTRVPCVESLGKMDVLKG
jgi:hypothetical protein